jgi:hypothetical protein
MQSSAIPVYRTRVGAAGDYGPDVAAGDPVGEVGVGEQGGRGDHHRAGPDAAEHRLPQLDLVAEHDQHPVARLEPGRGEPAGDLAGLLGHLGVRPGSDLAVLLDDRQRSDLGLLDRERVEPVVGPVEPLERRPAEVPVRRLVVLAVCDQEVPCRPELARDVRSALLRGHVPHITH